jgi:hypothetical protein
MLHSKSILQLKLLQALKKKKINNSRNIAVEQYNQIIPEQESEPDSEPESEPEQVPFLESEPVPNKSFPVQITLTEPIMEFATATPPSAPQIFQKKLIPIEQSETRKLFEEYEQFKYEQYLWNKLHGK